MGIKKERISLKSLHSKVTSLFYQKKIGFVLCLALAVLISAPAQLSAGPDTAPAPLAAAQGTEGIVEVTVFRIDYFDKKTDDPLPGVVVHIGKEARTTDRSGKTGFFQGPKPGYTYTVNVEETERHKRATTSFTIPLSHSPGDPFPVAIHVKDKALPKLIVVDKNQKNARSFRDLQPGESRILDAFVGDYSHKVTDKAEWKVSPPSVLSLELTAEGMKFTVEKMPAAKQCVIQTSYTTHKGDLLSSQSRVSVRVPPPPSQVEKVQETPRVIKKEVPQKKAKEKVPVVITPPAVDIPYTIIEGQPVTLRIKNYSPSYLYTWSIKKIVAGSPETLQTGQEPSVTRSFDAGRYEFEVKVSDSERITSKSVIERFSVQKPEVKPEPKPKIPSRVDQMIDAYGNLALFEVSPTEAEINEQVEFRVKAQFDEETAEEFQFNWFIDGQPVITSGKRLRVATTFPKPGEYNIDLKILNPKLQRTWTHSERIKIIPKPLPTENPAEFMGPAQEEMGKSAKFSVNYFISDLEYTYQINPPSGIPIKIVDQKFVLPITEERFKLGPNTVRVQVIDPSSGKTYTFERILQVKAKPSPKPAPVITPEPQPVEMNLAEFSGPELVQKGNVGKYNVLYKPTPPHQYYHVFLSGRQIYKKMNRQSFSVHFRQAGLFVIEVQFVDEQTGKTFKSTKRVQAIE